MPRREIGYDPPEIDDIPMDWRDMELIRSALRYYANGTAYTADPDSDESLNLRRRRRKGRASMLANVLDDSYPTTIDEDGTGDTVRSIEID